MKNKRGFLLGEYTLKLIIAVLCISLLFYLLFSLYAGYNQDKEMRLAKATLDELEEKMNLAKTNGEQKMIILNPGKNEFSIFKKGWLILAWPVGSNTDKPVQCNGNYCSCICPNPSYLRVGANLARLKAPTKVYLDFCNSHGACFDVEDKLIVQGQRPIQITPPLEILINYDKNEGFTITSTSK